MSIDIDTPFGTVWLRPGFERVVGPSFTTPEARPLVRVRVGHPNDPEHQEGFAFIDPRDVTGFFVKAGPDSKPTTLIYTRDGGYFLTHEPVEQLGKAFGFEIVEIERFELADFTPDEVRIR